MESEEQTYFHSIEDAFIELRGAPLLLSPTDWQIAMGWRRAGIPASFVISTLREMFAKRAERGTDGRISTLRYCKRRVEAQWKEMAELLAPGALRPGGDSSAPSLDLAARLEALSASLPPTWQPSRDLAVRVRAVAGATAEVEQELALLDQEMLATATESLSEADTRAVAECVNERLGGLEGRLAGGDRLALRTRVENEEIRRRLGLPFLSLFSLQAQPSS